VIADSQAAADGHLPDAESPYVAQVFFEHQSICGHFIGGYLFQRGIELTQSCDQRLIFPRGTERFLQAQRSVPEHARGREAGIAAAEGGVARQHDPPHPFGESGRPAPWPRGLTVDKSVGDGFRLHEEMGDDTAVEVLRGMNPDA
jgi:hypothetical protein